MPELPFFQRLKERKLVQWALAYLAGAWVLVESANLVVERFHWPEVIGQGVIVLALFGFLVTVVLAWYHGEKGRQRVSGPELLMVAALLVMAGGILTILPGEAPETPVASSTATRNSGDGRPSIAVLAFQNRSGREEDVYFTDGMQDQLITHLSKLGSLSVRSLTSVLAFRDSGMPLGEIAGALNARYVIEGGVQRAGGRVRLNIQLIDGATDDHMWADFFDRTLSPDSIFEIQTEIVEKVAEVVQALVTPEERARISAVPTQSLEALDLYLLGRHRLVPRSSENVREAIRYYEAAIEQDSTFAQAWAGVGMAWAILPFYEALPSREAYAPGREAALRAVELDEELGEAHAVLGALALYHEWDWESAERYLLRALELDRNYPEAYLWLGTVQCIQGQPERGVESLREGVRLNPLAGNFRNTLGFTLVSAGRDQEALTLYYGESRERTPRQPMLIPVLLKQGQEEEAAQLIRRWGESVGYRNAERLDVVVRATRAPELKTEALALVEELRKTVRVRKSELLGLYLLADAPAEAVRTVEEAVAEREVAFIHAGALFSQEWQEKYPEVVDALRAAGIPVH
jgi:TolB-like protein/tetratricopeptide (TPR) repeat protein